MRIIFYDPGQNVPSPCFRTVYTQHEKRLHLELSTLEMALTYINRAQFSALQLEKALAFHSHPGQHSEFSLLTTLFGLLCCFTAGPSMCYIKQRLPLQSHFLDQLIVRHRQIETWESTSQTACSSCNSPHLTVGYWNDHIRARSVLVTIALDVLLGLVLMWVLTMHSSAIRQIIHSLGSKLHIDVLIAEVDWLMSLPAGFKPNDPLDKMIGNSILSLIRFWDKYISTDLTEIEDHIIQCIGLAGVAGLTFQLCLIRDVINFCTLHVYYIYSLVSRVFLSSVEILISLGRLILGAKKNVLKNRIDSGDFAIDEILLGAIVFIACAFLFPTIVLYYLYFISTWIYIQLLQFSLMLGTVFTNHFPIFGAFSYFTAAHFFVSSIAFDLLSSSESQAYFRLRPQKLTFYKLFAPLLSELKQKTKESFIQSNK